MGGARWLGVVRDQGGGRWWWKPRRMRKRGQCERAMHGGWSCVSLGVEVGVGGGLMVKCWWSGGGGGRLGCCLFFLFFNQIYLGCNCNYVNNN
ncbi:hypothetical protein KSS87_019651 [Heliosperma pusillum]|nr:hypothetical protein KSS87_019651 [Heliosperma pusillum]